MRRKGLRDLTRPAFGIISTTSPQDYAFAACRVGFYSYGPPVRDVDI